MALHRMSSSQIKEFIRDYMDNRIFTSDDIREPDADSWGRTVSMVFLPLLFGGMESFSEEEKGDLAVVWAYHRDSLRRGINGYPCFMKARFMHKDDWDQVQEAIKTMNCVLDDVLEKVTSGT